MTTDIILTTQTVTALRKAGNLSEALSVAEELLTISPENIWNARAMGWVLLDKLKSEGLTASELNDALVRLLRLNLPTDEVLFYNQLRWRLGKVLYHCEANDASVLEHIIIQLLLKMSLQAGDAHSFLLKGILKHQESWVDVAASVQAWGYDNFREEDKQPEIMPGGKKANPLAERAYMAVAKWLLARHDDREEAFTQMIGGMGQALSEWKFLAYYYALLLKKQGRNEEALKVMVGYALRNRNSFWVWDLMSTLVQGETSTACLVRAVSCKAPEEYLVKIRQKLAANWVASGNWDAASYEIEKLVAARRQKGWPVPDQVMHWMASASYTKGSVDTPKGYTHLAEQADRLLLQDEKFLMGVIVGINDEKHTAQFYVSEQINGGFKIKPGDATLKLGQPVKLWLKEKSNATGTYWQVQHFVRADHVPAEDQRRHFSGVIRRAGSIGFVGKVLIPADLVAQTSPDWPVEGKALRSYDARKQKWGWKALEIGDAGKYLGVDSGSRAPIVNALKA